MEVLLQKLDEVPFLLPVAIMFLRIIDVSLGTIRMIMVLLWATWWECISNILWLSASR